MQGNEIRYNPTIVDETPYTRARAVARAYRAPLIFEDGDGFEMVAFPVNAHERGVVIADIGVLPLDAWDVYGPSVYDPDHDEHDPGRIPAPGTVHHGSLRPEDLIPAFMLKLEELSPERAAEITSMASGDGWPYSQAGLGFGDPFDEKQQELSTHLLTALFDALNEFAPPGYYFGANEGDGADFGFWQVEEDDLQFVDEGPYENDPYAGAVYDLQKSWDYSLMGWEDRWSDWIEKRIEGNTPVITDEDDPDFSDDAYSEAAMTVVDTVLDRLIRNWGWVRPDDD